MSNPSPQLKFTPEGPRVVLVTGGTKGIGRACAEWFVNNGDRVAVTSRSGPSADQLDLGDNFLSIRCDMTDRVQVEAAFSDIESAWGPVEVLVANAGITRDGLAVRMTEDAWSDVIDTNLTAVFRTCQRALTKMLRLRRGRIVMVSSASGFIGTPGQANYAAAKAGQLGLARSLAREVASRGITINVVAPGLVETDMLGALTPEQTATALAQVPLARVGGPDEIAGLIGYLASAEAGYITGALIPIDGGLSMGI